MCVFVCGYVKCVCVCVCVCVFVFVCACVRSIHLIFRLYSSKNWELYGAECYKQKQIMFARVEGYRQTQNQRE